MPFWMENACVHPGDRSCVVLRLHHAPRIHHVGNRLAGGPTTSSLSLSFFSSPPLVPFLCLCFSSPAWPWHEVAHTGSSEMSTSFIPRRRRASDSGGRCQGARDGSGALLGKPLAGTPTASCCRGPCPELLKGGDDDLVLLRPTMLLRHALRCLPRDEEGSQRCYRRWSVMLGDSDVLGNDATHHDRCCYHSFMDFASQIFFLQ